MVKSKIKAKIGIVIQARINSTRLPAKMLLYFKGKPMLLHLIERLRKTNLSDIIIVATSNNKENDLIADLCDDNDLICVRGSEENLVSRFKKVSKKLNLDVIVRLTGDNPLVSIEVIKKCITQHNNLKHDITTTRMIKNEKILKRSTPKGHSVDILNCNFLKNIDESKLDSYELEHIIPCFFDNKDKVNFINFNELKLKESSVDTLQDFYLLSIR